MAHSSLVYVVSTSQGGASSCSPCKCPAAPDWDPISGIHTV